MTDDHAAATGQPHFVITRLFQGAPQRLWEAWTKPEQLAQWFGPKGTVTTVLTFDLRPGGLLHSRLEGPGGSMWATFIYREVEEPVRLAWAHSFSNEQGEVTRAPFSETWPLRLLTTVLFKAHAGGTTLTLTWSPLDASPAEQQSFAQALPSMEMGWTGSFDQLARFLSGAAE